MAALPENWEWDYDGSRWFYRYKPTGIIQYTFPKPGDEFPEYVDDNATPLDLAPEERLVSQQQIKRRSTLGESARKQAAGAKWRERAASNVSSEQDDDASQFWLQPDGLMYMGPGAYNDISPLHEEDEEEERGEGSSTAVAADDGKRDIASRPRGDDPSPATTAAASPGKGTVATLRSHVSPLASAETTPQVPSIQPATVTPEMDQAVVVQSSDIVPADVEVATSPETEIPLLDSREVPYNPLGFVAELASELTARCDDEINPAPVELPGNEIMIYTSEPAPYANAFHLAPVELPSDEATAARKPTRNAAEQKSLASQSTRMQQEQHQQAQKAVQELLRRPYEPVRQNSTPQPANTVPQTSVGAAQPTPSKYLPYNPIRHGVLVTAAAKRHSTFELRSSAQANDDRRHSQAELAMPRAPPSDVPAALLPPHVPPKLPLNSAADAGQITIPGSGARHESISLPANQTPSGGLAHFPSVLQPARGRPVVRAQSPPQSQRVSPTRTYQAYKPYRDLQRDIDDTMQDLSKTGYGHGHATSTPSETSIRGRPQTSRTSTLPAHLPSLPYMGVRPHLPHSSASVPFAMQDLGSHQAPSSLGISGHVTLEEEAGTAMPQQYSAPLPSSSPDLPPPLNLSRKSSPLPSGVPTAVSSFRPPTTIELGMITSAGAPAPLNLVGGFTPALSSSELESNPKPEILQAATETVASSGQTEVASQLDATVVADLLPPAPTRVEGTALSNTSTASSEKLQSVRHTPLEQSIPSGSSITPEPSARSTPRVAASNHTSAVTPEFSDQPVLSTSSPVRVADVSPASTSTAAAAVQTEATPASGIREPSIVPAHEVSMVPGNHEQEPTGSEPALRGADEFIASRNTVDGPAEAPVSVQIVSQSNATDATAQVGDGPLTQPNMVPPTDEAIRIQASYVISANAATDQIPSDSRVAHVEQQQMTPPRSAVIPRVPSPSPRTPSPLSRASSPPTQQSNVSQGFPAISPPAVAMVSFVPEVPPAGQAPLGQVSIPAPAVGLGPSPMASFQSPLPDATPETTSSAPGNLFSTGGYPLASHPTDVSQLPGSGSPNKPDQAHTGGLDNQQEDSGLDFAQLASSAQVQPLSVIHKNAEHTASVGASYEQAPQATPPPAVPQHPLSNASHGTFVPASLPSLAQQGPGSSPPPVDHQIQMNGPPPLPLPLQAAGQAQLPMQQDGRMPSMQIIQGPPAVAPEAPGSATQSVHATFPPPTSTRPGQLPPQAPPGSAPPQFPLTVAPPRTHPSMQMQGSLTSMLPQQQYAYYQPGPFPQPGMQAVQHQQLPPHFMQPGQMSIGAHPVQPPPQFPQPPKEEKGWFGRLWRGDSVRKPTAVNAANQPSKLQKNTRPQQMHAVYPSPTHPHQQQMASPPQFIPTAPIQPHMMVMHPTQQLQPQQQGPGMNPQPSPSPSQHQQPGIPQPPSQQQQETPQPQGQQQQQQPLAWQTTNTSYATSAGSANSNPPAPSSPLMGQPINPQHLQFRAPSQGDHPNQPVLPPPHVRQVIQQQALRLQAARGSRAGGGSLGTGPGLGQAAPGAVQSQGQGLGQGLGGVSAAGGDEGLGGGVVWEGQGGGDVAAKHVGTRGNSGGGGAGGQTSAGAPALAGIAGAARWGPASTSGYDGSGWGDDFDD